MKYLKAIFCLMCIGLIAKGQTQDKWWGGYTVKEVVAKSELIFEGRILTDSPFIKSRIYTVHKVLVLKQFSGDFKSDTIIVITWGGRMRIDGEDESTPGAFAFKGDEAVFFAINSTKVGEGGNDPNSYWVFYGPGVSYVTVCDKKDVVKEVYEPIEAVTGHPYIELRPNTCEEQKKHKKPVGPIPMKPDGTPVESSPSPND